MAALYNINVPLHQALSNECWLRGKREHQEGGGGCFTVSNWLMFPLLTNQYSLCILTLLKMLSGIDNRNLQCFWTGRTRLCHITGQWRWQADWKLPLCWGLHQTEVQWAERSVWGYQLHSEEQEELPAPGDGAAPCSGKGKSMDQSSTFWGKY